ncbi:MAG TPA: ROK family transcriptional regulator [Streptosporangiaceae bacterium]|nr:ROK family transcriptional regulator [Streptosporangiaceae bacterium]
MDVGNIAELNTFLVLDAVRSQGRTTRSQLARELGLSDASVSRIIKRLIASGSVAELPGESAARGRTPSILEFVGSAGAVIAVDLGGTKCHGALADLAGGTVAEDFRLAGAGQNAAGVLLDCIAALKARAAELNRPVRALVVGIPALIDPATGLATAGPNVHWQGFDLLGILRDSLAEPFEVDNDVNLGALGQAWRGAGRGVSSFVLMSLGTGIGGAIVMDGHLIRGRHNAAGEMAYFPIWRGNTDGATGFEDVASGPALRARAAALIAAGEPTSLPTASFAVADIFKAAAVSDAVGHRVVRELVHDVAAAVAGTTSLIDPDRVILDGSIGRALRPWLGELRDLVAGQVFSAPEIVISDLGPNATVIGAIARALAMVSEQDLPQHLSRGALRGRAEPPRRASEGELQHR